MMEIGDVKEEIRKERPTASPVGSTLANFVPALSFSGKIVVVIVGDPPCPK